MGLGRQKIIIGIISGRRAYMAVREEWEVEEQEEDDDDGKEIEDIGG